MHRTIPPKIVVHYINPPSSTKRRLFLSSMLMLTLAIGLGSGAWLSWNSRFGKADREEVVTPTVLTNGAPAGIPIEFDQSELNVVANMLPILIQENRHEPSPEELKAAQRKEDLKNYLAVHKSPLAKDDTAVEALLRARNMKMILAISFVESNMCKKQVYYNCSGIGGSNIRHYKNFAAWIDDFDSLLERRYKGLAVEQFVGYYVQPGSQNWVDGVYQILDEIKLKHLE